MTFSPLDFSRDEAILAALERERQLGRAWLLFACWTRVNRCLRGRPLEAHARAVRRVRGLKVASDRRARVASALAKLCANNVRKVARDA